MATIKEVRKGVMRVTGIGADGVRVRQDFSQKRYGAQYRILADRKYQEVLFESSGLIEAHGMKTKNFRALTVDNLAERYIGEHLSLTRAGNNKSFVNIITKKWGAYRLPLVTIEAVRPWIFSLLNGGSYSPFSVKKVARYFQRIFNWGCEAGIINENPLAYLFDMSLKKAFARTIRPRMVEIPDDALDTLIKGAPTWLRDIIEMAYETGMRSGEICDARFSRLKGAILAVFPDGAKEAHPKVISLSARAVDIVTRIQIDREAAGNTEDHIFLSAANEPLRNYIVSRHWRLWADKAGLAGVWMHDLRHAFRTRKWREGVPERVIDKQLGHRSAEMADWYTMVNEEDQRQLHK